MTSTSFNVGLNAASRNSSKVLKPPGGGSSDIFGSSEPVEPQRKARAHLSSNIFAEEPAAPARNKAEEPPAPAESPVVNGTQSSTNSTVTSTAPTPTAPAPAAAAGRARVPPGGFSSGLW